MEDEPGREICDVKAVHLNACRCWKGCAIDGCWMMVRKHSLFYIRVPSVGDSRASRVAGGGGGWRCSGERWATLSRGTSAGGTSTKGVSVGLYAATCLVISYLTTHGEECGALPFSQKGRASPHGHELGQCRGNARGYWDQKKPRAGLPFFLFSAGQAWRRSRVLGCWRLSVATLKANNDPLPAAPQLSQQQPQEQGWLLVISAHRLAIQSCVSLLHAFVVFISVILKV